MANTMLPEFLSRGAPVLITQLFQLNAISVPEITEEGKTLEAAHTTGASGWNYANGLFLGAVDFGRAFHEHVTKYLSNADALLSYCSKVSALFFS